MTQEQYEAHQRKVGKLIAPDTSAAPTAPSRQLSRAKYGNEVTIVGGMRHASKREMKRYKENGLRLKSGEFDFLARQVRFRLPGGVEYVADFVLGKIIKQEFAEAFARIIVEDTKGVLTPVYRIKAKQMLSEHGIEVVEV